jgi:HlyD family secretion protein
MKKKVIFGLVILVVIAGAILGFTLIKKGKTSQVKYRTEALAKGDIESLVTTSGSLNPVDTVDVGSQVSGKILRLNADFNSKVTKGQILAELDLEPLRLKVDQAEANHRSRVASLEQSKVQLETSKKKFDRSKELFDKKQISMEEMETVEANYLNAKANLVSAESQLSQSKSSLDSSKVDLSYATIRAPIDGVVINRAVNIGQTVAASYQAPLLFKLASDLAKMQLQCDIDETDIGKVKEGQKVRFTVSAYQGETFNGVVKQVRYSPLTTQNVVTYTTIVSADNPDLKLLPGMTATVSIITNEAKAVLKVANSALRFTPAMPQAELQKILAQYLPQTQQKQGGQPGQKAEGEQGQRIQGQTSQNPSGEGGQRQSGQRQGGFQAGQVNFEDMTPEQRQRLQQMMANRQRQSGRVWVMDDQGSLRPYAVRLGITDNTYTEITRSELAEGLKIIIGLETPQTAATQQQQGGMGGRGGPGQMMFIGR